MVTRVTMKKEETLEKVTEKIVAELREKFPQAEYVIKGETYEDEDLCIDIYVNEEDLLALDRLANEVTFRYWEKTGYDILPMVAPMECCPIKR